MNLALHPDDPTTITAICFKLSQKNKDGCIAHTGFIYKFDLKVMMIKNVNQMQSPWSVLMLCPLSFLCISEFCDMEISDSDSDSELMYGLSYICMEFVWNIFSS